MKHLSTVITICRWVSRVVGGLVVLLVVAIAIGEGMTNPLHQPLVVNLSFIALLMMLIGQVTAWWREGIGGALVLAGWGGFELLNHGVRLNVVFAPMLLTGLFYVFSGWLKRRKS